MQHLICMVYVGRENLSNIKSKYGKKEGGGGSRGSVVTNLGSGRNCP